MRNLLFPLLILLACGGQKSTNMGQTKKYPYMHIAVKNYGEIVIKLFPDEAPKNVKNIIDLTNKGFYNGLKFHRVIKGFVIQGGCPKGDGTGDPGYELEDEISPKLKHLKGTVAMANRGPNTNGSQFYICLEPQPRLDGRYTIIGEVVQGMDVVEKIGEVPTSGPPYDRPLNDVIMEKVWIEER
ncbi:MAG: peptidylprolyl isomerase [candidate division WOR-3 bacterium]|nr:peptidylprolyl isomerase [candidate division WOR-3 bacterium]